jgi:hypothetical protein
MATNGMEERFIVVLRLAIHRPHHSNPGTLSTQRDSDLSAVEHAGMDKPRIDIHPPPQQ